jgi:hypothetical protein
VLPAPGSSAATAPVSMTSGSHAAGSGELDDATDLERGDD